MLALHSGVSGRPSMPLVHVGILLDFFFHQFRVVFSVPATLLQPPAGFALVSYWCFPIIFSSSSFLFALLSYFPPLTGPLNFR